MEIYAKDFGLEERENIKNVERYFDTVESILDAIREFIRTHQNVKLLRADDPRAIMNGFIIEDDDDNCEYFKISTIVVRQSEMGELLINLTDDEHFNHFKNLLIF